MINKQSMNFQILCGKIIYFPSTSFVKWKKFSKDAIVIFKHVKTCTMIFDEEENQSRLRSKSRTLCTGPLHRRGIWSKHIDAHKEIFFGMRIFPRAKVTEV